MINPLNLNITSVKITNIIPSRDIPHKFFPCPNYTRDICLFYFTGFPWASNEWSLRFPGPGNTTPKSNMTVVATITYNNHAPETKTFYFVPNNSYSSEHYVLAGTPTSVTINSVSPSADDYFDYSTIICETI